MSNKQEKGQINKNLYEKGMYNEQIQDNYL